MYLDHFGLHRQPFSEHASAEALWQDTVTADAPLFADCARRKTQTRQAVRSGERSVLSQPPVLH